MEILTIATLLLFTALIVGAGIKSPSFGLSFLGIFIGGMITFFVSRYYSLKATKELQEETRKLRKLIGDIGIFLQNTGLNKDTFRFDEEGNIIGLRISLSGKSPTKTRAEASIDKKVDQSNKLDN